MYINARSRHSMVIADEETLGRADLGLLTNPKTNNGHRQGLSTPPSPLPWCASQCRGDTGSGANGESPATVNSQLRRHPVADVDVAQCTAGGKDFILLTGAAVRLAMTRCVSTRVFKFASVSIFLALAACYYGPDYYYHSGYYAPGHGYYGYALYTTGYYGPYGSYYRPYGYYGPYGYCRPYGPYGYCGPYYRPYYYGPYFGFGFYRRYGYGHHHHGHHHHDHRHR
jgi:hypothetical protein